tara:strand:- start:178 stop:372 length:195 start_codon:yes stop_codon:yes gene_type:complete
MKIVIIFIIILNFNTTLAVGYVDPGIFSLFLTYLISGVVGFYIIFKNKLNKIKDKIMKYLNKKK